MFFNLFHARFPFCYLRQYLYFRTFVLFSQLAFCTRLVSQILCA
uniref:Uncharacterized protein n=2 Tax=unclassified Caudoviricetes TaxID=2788787 RepID=A0A8S5ULE6_9CAUD|nr:MAG TPA: hypothetical protein [Siphoviridae sp. ctEQg15]DAF95251.1 MAG TPA: hypothetical protein [Siphoviridae sp. ctOH142]